MSGQRRQVVGAGAAVLVGVGVGIATEVVTDAPRIGAIAALVALTAALIAIKIGLRMSESEGGAKPDQPSGPAAGHVSSRTVNGGTSYAAGRDIGLTPGHTVAVGATIVLVVIAMVVAGVLILGNEADGGKGLPLPPSPGLTVPSDDSSPTPTASASSPSPPPLPRSEVPDRLVGTWSGGTDGATANWTYTFADNGEVEQSNGRIGVHRAGTVVVATTTLTLYFPGRQPETFRWKVSSIDGGFGYTFSNLQLNGLSYVRQDTEP
ncbi:hypothetical protein [Couchioplanes caeruleus]|uniref:Uncharacterized protein n=2 Tax=Couchioplanes caeruleus TaxID=56438 RepID=A0A1K0GPF7_9ACTN|nr:hypothetical protein [Couchioplanes caeruleus]OJF11115.1 hypothetical protein BG844_28675 [Couchioplanes caeruleus subsp. caeruleus]ROP33752.1 hypothetical protein EDD30_6789 [Couchioplanes caeruleus]